MAGLGVLFFIVLSSFYSVFCGRVPFLFPLPESYHEKESPDDIYLILNYKSFVFDQQYPMQDFVDAITRYRSIIFFDQDYKELTICPKSQKCIEKIVFSIENHTISKPVPHLGEKENYSLVVDGQTVNVNCKEIFGCYHALETISQMIKVDETDGRYYVENYFPINDIPRFMHRGMMVDTSRHYLSLSIIKKIIDALSYSKMNTLHWHMVDAQSFPFQCQKYPNLSKIGSYSQNAIYKHSDLVNIQEYARKRGIRMIVEVDVPGHSGSWKGVPVLADCVEENVNRYVLNPTIQETYNVIDSIIKELTDVFPSPFIHLGGDEVNYDCWQQDDKITKWMKDHSIESYDHLLGYFEGKLHTIYSSYNKTLICWEECLLRDGEKEHYVLPKETIVQVWKTATRYDHLHEVISTRKYKALFSGGFYLNYYQNLGWKDYYLNEPFSKYEYTKEEKERLIGGEACLWGEHVDDINFFQKERLWSNEKVVDTNNAADRIEYYRCMLVHRGIDSAPLQPSYCKWVYE